MERPQRETRKQAWARRLADHTLLRMLVLNFWFRLVFVLFVLGMVGLALSWPKMWRTSPQGIRPVTKVSLIDLVQVWMLNRSAKGLAEAGKVTEAISAWRSALANNSADRESLRGFLKSVAQAEEIDRSTALEALNGASWLLRLAQTNRSDIAIVVQVYDKLEKFSDVCQLLEPLKDQLAQDEEAAYLKALFRMGRTEEFAERWRRAGGGFAEHPELALLHAAYMAGWGPPGSIGVSLDRIKAAVADPKRRGLALRLQLLLYRKSQDVKACETILNQLEANNLARMDDWIAFWGMLKNAGHTEEAARLAEAFAGWPRAPMELVRLADAYSGLGMPERAKALYERYAPEYGDAEGPMAWNVWANYAALLIEKREWLELQAMALRMRLLRGASVSLAGFSQFMEGRALQGLGQHELAVIAFRNAVKLGFPDANFRLQAGIDLLRLEHNELAWDMLKPLERELDSDLRYWLALCDAAHALKRDSSVLLRIATRAYELAPNDPGAQYNYASALIVNRKRPEEAAKLTLSWVTRSTNAPGALVLHGAALAMNQRFEEADQVLSSINPQNLAPTARSFYHLTVLETHVGLRQFDRAYDDLNRIQVGHLFPTQTAWLERTRGQLPPRSRRRPKRSQMLRTGCHHPLP